MGDLKPIVQDLASKVRNLTKIVEATQAFCTTLADQVDTLEESIYKDLREIRGVHSATASETDRIFKDIAKAADDLLG